jgi:L-iditol 2-dehydrogenase
MRALEFTAGLEARVIDTEPPTPGPDEVLVGITSAGVCGSDVAALRGTHPFRRPPLITGHEGGGRVVEVGRGVDRGWIGRQVALDPQRACGECGPCAEDLPHLCRDRLMLGMPGWSGTLAEYVTAPLACLHAVADEVPEGLLALAEPLAVAHHAQRRAPDLGGKRVGVLGGGPIGALQVVTAREAGGEVAVVTDPRAHCRAAALALGAAEAVEPAGADHLAGTLDVVFVAAAAPVLVDQAIALVKPRGTIVQVGLFAGPVEVDVLALQQDEKTLTGATVYTADDVAAAVRTLERSWRDLGALATDVGSLDAVAEHLRAVLDGRGPDVIKVLVRPDGGSLEVGA